MNALTLPRTVVALEYKALRYPSQLLATRLPAENALRLVLDRVLGSLDSTAGQLLDDDGLKDRGRILTRRIEVLEKAEELEAKADARRAEADAKMRASQAKVQAEKDRIRTDYEQTTARHEAERKAADAALSKKAKARQRADDKEIVDTTASVLTAERDRLNAQEAAIEVRKNARTAAPKAQLSKAAADTQAAAQARSDADRLAALATAERKSRKDN